ncbi:hypothetical protein GDO78_004671 [Eleutherodactylus coqui]|uniref:Uncharacterized protein n=1 Tax=Eleutherodactylus coqui TaxID=57060 RepID=A0A8J6K055_ELECQ|nr:hypothetical protein GDO78_004671 [Eleutherodactylus coqui]
MAIIDVPGIDRVKAQQTAWMEMIRRSDIMQNIGYSKCYFPVCAACMERRGRPLPTRFSPTALSIYKHYLNAMCKLSAELAAEFLPSYSFSGTLLASRTCSGFVEICCTDFI